jgi:membrane protein
MTSQLKTATATLTRIIWNTDLELLPAWRAMLTRLARIMFAVVRDLAEGQLTLRAMGLVYTTLLSLVPLLAVSFSVLKAFGFHNQMEPMLLNFTEPLGPQGAEITANIVTFVDNVDVGILGAVGVAMLFYTVVALMQKIESAFNYTWRVSQSRSIQQRFSHYLSVLMIGPLLVFAAIGLTGSLLNSDVVLWLSDIPGVGFLVESVSRLLPYLFIIIAFMFVYVFIPNTRVTMGAALAGAIVAGFLWQTSGWVFATFVANSGKYAAIYSAFATLMLFLIWLYLGWLILLTGASIGFYVQNPDYVSSPRRNLSLSNVDREKLALSALKRIAYNYYHNLEPLSKHQLGIMLNTPSEIVSRLLYALEMQGLLKQTNDDPPSYLPAKPLDEITVAEVLHAVRANGDDYFVQDTASVDEEIEGLFHELDQSISEQLGSRTIKSMVTGQARDT